VTNGAHRKVVTVLFCDVEGSTALGESVDPEALQAVLARYFERMKGIVEPLRGAARHLTATGGLDGEEPSGRERRKYLRSLEPQA
jgi:class 3 adenylate cyclase